MFDDKVLLAGVNRSPDEAGFRAGNEGTTQLKRQPRGDRRLLGLVADYAVPNVSDKVLSTILSYTDYFRRTVWRRF